MKKIYKYFGAVALFLGSLSINAQTVIIDEDFTGATGTTPPLGWTNNDIQGAGDAWAYNNPGGRTINAPMSSPTAIFDSDSESNNGSPENVALESPQFDASALSGFLFLEFDHYFNGGFGGEYFVEVFDGTSWIQVLNGTSDTGNPQSESINITAEANGASNAQVRFRWEGSWSNWWILDNIQVLDVTCPDPSSLTASNVLGTSVDLGWTENGSATAWNIEYGAPGFTLGSGTTVNGVSNPHNQTGLTPETTYEYYVQADCGGGDLSTWVGPFEFTTSQIPVSTFPWDEDFETGAADWTILNGTETNQWFVGSAINNGGSNSLYVSNDGGTTHAYTNTITSEVHGYRDVTLPATAVSAILSFDFIGDAETSFDNVRVFLVPTSFIPNAGSQIFTSGTPPTGRVNLSGNISEITSFENQSFNIPAAYMGETFRIVFQWKNDGSAGQDPPAAIDNVNISVFNCAAPSGLVASDIASDEATVSWDDNTSGAPSFEVEYGPAGFTPGTGTTVVVTDTFAILTGLTQDQDYDYYVSAECGDGTFSQQSSVGSFTTLIACDQVTNVSVVDVTTTTVELTWSAPVGYADFIIEYGPAGFTPGSGTQVAAPPVIVTGLDDDTEYDFYVYSDCGAGVTSQPAGPVSATTPPICPEPTDLTFSDIGADSVVVSWTAGGSETDWVIEYGVSGFTIGSGTQVLTTDNPDTLLGLSPEETYDVYIWADCGGGDLSDTISDSFTTQPTCLAPSDLVFSEEGADSVVVEWTANGTATTWVIEYDTAGFVLGTGTQVITTDNPDTLLGLNPEWTYDVYVWSDCGAGDLSDTISGDFTTQPTCLPISDLTTSDVGPDSVVVSWTANGTETSWNIEYGPEGFTPGTGTVITGGTNPDTITGLDGATSYDVYVTADCGAGDLADTVGPINFITEGSCGNYELSLEDDFGDGWETSSEINIYVNGNLFLGGVTLAGGSGPEIIEIPMNINDILSIEYSSSGFFADEESYEVFDEQGNLVGEQGTSGDIPGSIGDFNVPSGIVACATCPVPSDIALDSVGLDFGDISWTSNGAETSWNIEFDTTGFTLGSGNFVDGTTDNPYSVTGLQSGATYDVYVQASCSASDSSGWVGPFTFSTAFSCQDTLYDNGGPTGDYANNSDDIYRMIAGSANQYVRLTFEEFDTESGWDGIYVYDGDDVNDSLLGSTDPGSNGFVSDSGAWFGDNIPGPFYSSNAQGALTMNFGSDGSVPNPGFKGYVDCFDCDPTPGVDGSIDFCRLDDTLDLNTIVTLPTHPDSSRMGQWMFPVNPGVLIQDSLLVLTSIAEGTYEAMYVLNTPCGGDTTIATINVFGPSQAGANGTLTVCLNEPINLYDGLSGNADLGGDWYDPSNDLLPNSQPTASNIPGNYNYDYVTSNGVCPADTALVEVIVDGGCDWLSIGEEEMNEISVYPNPATNVINVVNPANTAALKVEIFDVNGRVVVSDDKALENSTEGSIAIDHLETGIYTLRIYGENGQKTFKIVKK